MGTGGEYEPFEQAAWASPRSGWVVRAILLNLKATLRRQKGYRKAERAEYTKTKSV